VSSRHGLQQLTAPSYRQLMGRVGPEPEGPGPSLLAERPCPVPASRRRSVGFTQPSTSARLKRYVRPSRRYGNPRSFPTRRSPRAGCPAACRARRSRGTPHTPPAPRVGPMATPPVPEGRTQGQHRPAALFSTGAGRQGEPGRRRALRRVSPCSWTKVCHESRREVNRNPISGFVCSYQSCAFRLTTSRCGSEALPPVFVRTRPGRTGPNDAFSPWWPPCTGVQS
jgi:hypothetical protein